jgi:hypothetical protein
LFEDNVQALWDVIKAHKHQDELFLHQIGQIHEQMDDQDRLVAKLEEQFQEAMEEFMSQSREITDVYVRLGRAEERIALQSWALEALNNPAAPPTTTAASTQTEDPSPLSAPNPSTPAVHTTAASNQTGDVLMAEGPTMPLGEEVGRPSAMPPALDTQMPAAPSSAAPPPLTIEVQGPTPLNSQEGDKAAVREYMPRNQVDNQDGDGKSPSYCLIYIRITITT